MFDVVQIALPDAEKTESAGKSLAQTIYSTPVTVHLKGDVGAGKTTFVRGFAHGLGIQEHITSPTFALEQRYANARHPLLHLDLYRLSEEQATALVETSDDFDGIRCIEWPQRLVNEQSHIEIELSESGSGRELRADFRDIPLPSEQDISQWREDVRIPQHIINHCEAVARVAEQCANILLARGELVRKHAVLCAAKLHDLLRFVDFDPSQAYITGDVSHDDEKIWTSIRNAYDGLGHESACAQYLTERGFAEIGAIIRPHGLQKERSSLETTEQKILFYADKRAKFDTIVTVEERFNDFVKRYGNGVMSTQAKTWLAQTKEIEEELFPEGEPDLTS